MFKKETEYALRAVIYIQAQNIDKRRPGIVEIASETEAPQPFIAKILHKLVRQGVLSSIKGKGGGFFIDSQVPSPTLKELITLMEGDKIFTGCGFGMKSCDENNPCPLHESYSVIRQKINDLVSSETVHSMAMKTREKKQVSIFP